MDTTKLSTKGQIVLPKSLRDARHWAEGTEFEIEARPEGLLLRPARMFPATTIDSVFGSLAYSGKPKTIEEMNAGVLREAQRKFGKARAAHSK